MAGLVPAIHALLRGQDVDARDKRGHDDGWFRANGNYVYLPGSNSMLLTPITIGA